MAGKLLSDCFMVGKGKGWHNESGYHSMARLTGASGKPKTYHIRKGESTKSFIERWSGVKQNPLPKGYHKRVNSIEVDEQQKNTTRLTDEESKAYDYAMTFYDGDEKKVVKDLENEFPRLKKYSKWK